MTFIELEPLLIERFGTNEVATSDVVRSIVDMGFDASKFYRDIKNKYSIGRGRIRFVSPTEVVVTETEEQINERLNKTFAALDKVVRATAKGLNRSLIIVGPAGVGKSFGVEKALKETVGDYTVTKGHVSSMGLYKQLYENRFPNSVIVFDDVDVFDNETTLNILKAVCDGNDMRKVSWDSKASIVDNDGQEVPKSFVFEGSVIFITNKDIGSIVEKDVKLSQHINAMLSRSLFVDIGIKTVQDYLVRIRQVISTGMLDKTLEYSDQQTLMFYLSENASKMHELSLRMVNKLASLMQIDPENWKDLAKTFCQKA